VEFGALLPPHRPYYSGDSDTAILPALEAQARLLGTDRASLARQSSYSDRPVASVNGDLGRGWGIAYEVPGGGFDNTLALCETTLLPLGYATVEYVPGMLRVYYSQDRRTEVVLAAGRKWQLLLAVNQYDPPLPGEAEQAMRDDARRYGRELGELVQTEGLELARAEKE
jgi:hypothetical protein